MKVLHHFCQSYYNHDKLYKVFTKGVHLCFHGIQHFMAWKPILLSFLFKLSNHVNDTKYFNRNVKLTMKTILHMRIFS